MGKKAKERLSQCLNRLLEEGRTTFTELVKSGGVTNGTLGRILSEEGQNIQLETLDDLAAALQVEPWQLLHPDGEVASMSKDALKIARKMESLNPAIRDTAYALWVQRVDFENEQQPPPPEPPNGAPSAPDKKQPIRVRRVRR